MSTDRNIEAAVREELVSDPLLDANGIVVEVAGGAVSLNAVPDSVKATARNGTLFLAGTVSGTGQRDAAQDAAAGVAGVFSITNEIDVRGDT